MLFPNHCSLRFPFSSLRFSPWEGPDSPNILVYIFYLENSSLCLTQFSLAAPDLVLQTVTSASLTFPAPLVPAGISARVHSQVEGVGSGRAAGTSSGPCILYRPLQ